MGFDVGPRPEREAVRGGNRILITPKNSSDCAGCESVVTWKLCSNLVGRESPLRQNKKGFKKLQI
jgi:hypothetical protein